MTTLGDNYDTTSNNRSKYNLINTRRRQNDNNSQKHQAVVSSQNQKQTLTIPTNSDQHVCSIDQETLSRNLQNITSSRLATLKNNNKHTKRLRRYSRLSNTMSSILFNPSNLLSFSSLLILFFVLLSTQNNSSVSAQDQNDQPLLFCQPNKMFIRISKSYLRKNNIEVKQATQLYFRGHSSCFAQEENDDYILTLFNPFTACGTDLEHTSEDYIYTNEVVLDRRDGNGGTKLLEMRCVYEDKYIVSSGPIKPTKNTLTFTTEFGEFETKMTLYNNSRFDSMAKLSDSPIIRLGSPLYVAVSMYIPFNPEYNNDFTITIKSCFANQVPDHTQMDRYHYLISGMCASPDDPTVSIYKNGAYSDTEARFGFDMFRFKDGSVGEYIYIHCEVKLCNTTVEVCNGEGAGPKCNGRDPNKANSRRKRSTYFNQIESPIITRNNQKFIEVSAHSETILQRSKRAFEDIPAAGSNDGLDSMPDPEDDSLAYLSRGPVRFEQVTQENNAEKSGLLVTLGTVRSEQSYLRLWVFSGVAAVIGVIGVILTIVTVWKRRNERIKLQNHGTVITAPAASKSANTWRQGPLPSIPNKDNNGE